MDFTNLERPINDQPIEAEERSSFPSTCARTNSVLVKQEHSKCHLRVRRVENKVGPQTGPNYLNALDKLMTTDTKLAKVNTEGTQNPYHQHSKTAIGERLTTIEDHLHLYAEGSSNIYTRLKAIENRILDLESISPEYKHFMRDMGSWISTYNEQEKPNQRSSTHHSDNHKSYTANELDAIISQIQAPS